MHRCWCSSIQSLEACGWHIYGVIYLYLVCLFSWVLFSQCQSSEVCARAVFFALLNHVIYVVVVFQICFFVCFCFFSEVSGLCVLWSGVHFYYVLSCSLRFCVEMWWCSLSWKIFVRLGITYSSHDCSTKTPLCGQHIWDFMSRWVGCFAKI